MNVALRPQHLDILSICTGGGGLDLGVELAIPSARTVCMVEREAFAVAHLVSAMENRLLGPAPIWSDARTFNGRRWRGAIDGVIGGIPCQPHSLAGKRLGEDDERDLWGTARRIIVQSGAWFVLIENVGGMLSSGGAQRVWRDLRRLGFAVEGGLFTAAQVGASHERERLFILAMADASDARPQRREWAGAFAERGGSAASRSAAELCATPLDNAVNWRWAAGRDDNGAHVRNEPDTAGEHPLVNAEGNRWREGRPEPEFQEGHGPAVDLASASMEDASIKRARPVPIRSWRQGEAHADADRPSVFPPGPGDIDAWRNVLARAPQLEPAVRRMADGLASRVDQLRMLGNGVVPLQAAYAVRTLATRLAERGSAGAARLVRMMGEQA